MQQNPFMQISEWLDAFGSRRTTNLEDLRGSQIWPNAVLYHGGDLESVHDIVTNGVDLAQSSGGYFGFGFYVTDDLDLAWSHYAGNGRGGVVELRLSDKANILDLRSAKDAQIWATMPRPGSDRLLERALARQKIDGVFDRAMGGICLYNTGCFSVVGLAPAPRAAAGAMP